MYVKMLIKNQKINIPKGISVEIGKNLITISNSKEKTSIRITKAFKVYLSENGSLVLCGSPLVKKVRRRIIRRLSPMTGTLRANIMSAISGLTTGFSKEIEVVGVGYKAECLSSNKLSLKLGYSHDVLIDISKNIEVVCPKETLIILRSNCNESLGSFITELKKSKVPDIYKNKGVLIKGEDLLSKKFKKK